MLFKSVVSSKRIPLFRAIFLPKSGWHKANFCYPTLLYTHSCLFSGVPHFKNSQRNLSWGLVLVLSFVSWSLFLSHITSPYLAVQDMRLRGCGLPGILVTSVLGLGLPNWLPCKACCAHPCCFSLLSCLCILMVSPGVSRYPSLPWSYALFSWA